MKSGGYKVIDLKNIPLSNFAVNFPGIYEQIEASNKLCVVSGLNAGSVEYDDVAVLFRGGSTFTAKIHDTLILSVKDTDDVTVIVTEAVENMEYVDFTGIDTADSKIENNIILYRSIINKLAKKKPFYLYNIDLEFVAGNNSMKNCSVLVNSYDATPINCGYFVVVDSVTHSLYTVTINPKYDNFAINFIVGG